MPTTCCRSDVTVHSLESDAGPAKTVWLRIANLVKQVLVGDAMLEAADDEVSDREVDPEDLADDVSGRHALPDGCTGEGRRDDVSGAKGEAARDRPGGKVEAITVQTLLWF